MSVWDTYPSEYRSKEVQRILLAAQAGECVSVVGLSGAGKSNLLGFLAHRPDVLQVQLPEARLSLALVDCNRLPEGAPAAFLGLVSEALAPQADDPPATTLSALERLAARRLAEAGSICLLFDRFDLLDGTVLAPISGNLRALRDAHKYDLTYVIATRRPLDPSSELAELFYGNTLWLGPLSPSDARWTVTRYASRKGYAWDSPVVERLIELTWGYPAFLRAACEAYASGAATGVGLDPGELRQHPAVQRRVAEFWADAPGPGDLEQSGLAGHPFLERSPAVQAGPRVDNALLTAKEHLLLAYLQAHPGEVCEKDALVRAVWPEDRIFTTGIRDDSLAQLVRRLRKKIEPDPDAPRYLHTVPGRGYRYLP